MLSKVHNCPCSVKVGHYEPPPHYQVPALMHMFIDEVNRKWEVVDPVFLSAFVLWKLNHIHPFVNGNGRTARAACYFILCMKLGKWIDGNPILPELIRKRRADYVKALETATNSAANGVPNLRPLHALLEELLQEQGNQVRP
jgi:Fic family protein